MIASLGAGADVGAFPTTDQGVEALISRPSDVSEEVWQEDGYMEVLPLDAWGRPFAYKYPGERGKYYDLFSVGKDGRGGTDDDIYDRRRGEQEASG